MEENRFLRAYHDHKKEKELERESIRPNYDNRFECLKDRAPPREINSRFECLRSNNSINSHDSRLQRDTTNRFNCLIDDDYRSISVPSSPALSSIPTSPSLSSPRSITYLPRPEPKESINEQMRRFRAEKKASEPPPKPVMTFESEYHFPELCKSLKSEVKLPELKLPEQKQKEMIVNTIIVPIKKKTMSVFSFSNGKMITKEVYEDGSDVVEPDLVMVKKANYSSWASVLKKEDKNEIIYYEKEEK